MDTSDTDFLAYQFKPILKLLESPTNSLLIADEVGLGKTIEAGLIWTELRAREGARTLLVVCPPHLVTKWRKELKRRFGVHAQAAGPAEVLEMLEDSRRNQTDGFALIATYHGLRPPKGWEDEARSPAARLAHQLAAWGDSEHPLLDLLVMDEAAICATRKAKLQARWSLDAHSPAPGLLVGHSAAHPRAQLAYALAPSRSRHVPRRAHLCFHS